jgi:hypothetical protein
MSFDMEEAFEEALSSVTEKTLSIIPNRETRSSTCSVLEVQKSDETPEHK